MWVEWFVPLKQAHVALVGASVGLFMARGAAALAGRSWPMAAWARRGSVVIDTLLLAAGVGLWLRLGLNPLRDTWLGSKLLMLVLYVVLGSLALKRARSTAARALCFAAALAVVGTMVTVAMTRHPLGWMAP